MRLLLDTHLLLWAQIAPSRLSARGRALIEEPANDLSFSTVSIAEVAIKFALRRPEFEVDPRVLRRALLDNGYEELPLLGAHACALADLPQLHRDPFDRMLVAQAMMEGVTLLTGDAAVARYGGMVRGV